MKYILTFILLISSAFAAPIYTVTDSGSVLEDGRDIGEVATVIVTKFVDYKLIQPAIVTALTASKTAAAAELIETKVKAAADLAAAEAKFATIIAKLNDPNATKADAEAEARKTERQRRLDEATKRLAEAQAARDAIEAEPAIEPERLRTTP